MSKGSVRRPLQVDDSQMQENWDRIFGGKDDDQTVMDFSEPEDNSE